MRKLFENTVSAICYTIVGDFFEHGAISPSFQCNSVVRFVLNEHRLAPTFLRLPLMLVTVLFDFQCLLTTGRLFHHQSPEVRAAYVQGWKISRLGPCRDFIRFYASLAALPWYADQNEK